MPRSLSSLCALGAAALLGLGCFGGRPLQDEVAREAPVAETTPLGGEALDQRRRDLERAHEALIHYQWTLRSLRHRHEHQNLEIFRRFVGAYMREHLDALIRSEWQSHHPELMALDANLRLMKADLLLRMREKSHVGDVMRDLEERFQGSEQILVEYPVGEQNTLARALELLRKPEALGL